MKRPWPNNFIDFWYGSINLWLLGLFRKVLEIEQTLRSLAVGEFIQLQVVTYLHDTSLESFNEYI